MPVWRTPWIGLAAVLCVTAVAACGGGDPGPAPEISTGTAPTGQQPVSVRDYGTQGVGDGEEWPRACDLITRDEVQAVLPQATDVQLKGASGSFDYQVVGQDSYHLPKGWTRYAEPRRIDVPEQKCEARLKLPSDAAEDDTGVYASIDVNVDMVGSKDTVDYFWSPGSGSQPLPDSFGAEECIAQPVVEGVEAVSTFQCRKGEMSITVTGDVGGLEDISPNTHKQTDEVYPHVRLAGQPANTPVPQVYDWFRTQVVPQLVGVAARRMP
jgi:hypothetical protein